MTLDTSKDVKVGVGEGRSLQGSRRRNAVPPPTAEEEHESRTDEVCYDGEALRNSIKELSRGSVKSNPSVNESKDINLWVLAKSPIAVY